MKKNIAVAVICLCYLITPVQAKPLQFVSINWPPYVGENLTHQGFVSEIIELACKNGNIEPSFRFLPAKRAIMLTERGQYAAMFPYMNQSNDSFILSEPFAGSALVFYKNKFTPPVRFESLVDLKSYKIAVVAGHSYTKEFDEAVYLNKDITPNVESCFKKLARKRVDLVLANKYVATELFKDKLSNIALQIDQIDPPFAVQPFYLAFSKTYPGIDTSVRQFNRGLQTIKRDGRINAVLDKYGYFTISSSSLSPKELEHFVKSALNYVDQNGMDKAVVEFKKPKGHFSKGELYIFVIGMDGLMVSHIFPNLVTTNVMNMQDKFGSYIFKELTRTIKEKGSGWVEYWWPNPITKKVQPKVSYVHRIDKNYYLGAGIYR